MDKIISNNFTIQRNFDDMFDGLASPRYMSKKEAEDSIKEKKQNIYTSYQVIEHISIIGIVPFNDRSAYVFNIEPPICKDSEDEILITSGTFENLMNCYVYQPTSISRKLGEKLEKEYYERGGIKYNTYHDFEDKILCKERSRRQQNYRTQIVETIFKHDFREIGKLRWSNGNVLVKQISHGILSMKYNAVKNHTDLDVDLNMSMMIGSLFGLYLEEVSQLSDNKFCVRCNKKDRRKYHFTCFEITFNQ